MPKTPVMSEPAPHRPDAPAARVVFADNDAARELGGELGVHLKQIGRALDVSISQRGAEVLIAGAGDRDLAARVLRGLYLLAEEGRSLQPADIRHALRILSDDANADLRTYFNDTVLVAVDGTPIAPRSAGQKAYVSMLRRHDVCFGVGPAGTGKTYLAMAVAVAALQRGEVKKIVLTRPAVEAGEKLGFLPGDLNEKVDPYLRPLYDALGDMIPAERVQRLFERHTIEVAPLAFMRGRTLAGAYVILDEGQNTTREQMKMFLTRLGEGSRMVITGDITQVDLPRRSDSGLIHALGVLERVNAIGVARLGSGDVVRHPLVAAIIDAYDASDRVKSP